MRETYKVKRPDRITWGDPSYMEGFPDIMLNTMTIYLAPKQTIETYMQNMMYELQQHTEKMQAQGLRQG